MARTQFKWLCARFLVSFIIIDLSNKQWPFWHAIEYNNNICSCTIGIRIHSSTNRLIVGTEISVRVVGPDGESPFTLGAVGIAFHWESVDPTIANVAPIYKEGIANQSFVEGQNQY